MDEEETGDEDLEVDEVVTEVDEDLVPLGVLPEAELPLEVAVLPSMPTTRGLSLLLEHKIFPQVSILVDYLNIKPDLRCNA